MEKSYQQELEEANALGTAVVCFLFVITAGGVRLLIALFDWLFK